MAKNSALETVDAKHGRFTFPKNDVYIGKSLRTYGEFCEHEFKIMSQVLRPGQVAVDAGANIGCFSVPMSKALGPKGILYAFEPQPFIQSILSHNLLQNQCENTRCLTIALGRKSDEILVPNFDYISRNNFGGMSFANGFNEKKGTAQIRVPCARLDDVIDPPSLRFIKADVEKMEADFLLGASGLIEEFKPILFLECDIPEDFIPIARVLNKWDYEQYWHVSPLFMKNNWAKNPKNIFGKTYTVNLLCVKAGTNIKGMTKVNGKESHPKFIT